MRRTKIVCTLGPATDAEGVLEALVNEGMDVARLNFSHGDYSEHKKNIDRIRSITDKTKRPVAILLDTKGPEIRTGNFKDGKVVLQQGQEFTLRCYESEGNEEGVSVTYTDLYKDIHEGDTILIDDGLIELNVSSVNDKDIVCKVINSGAVSNHKGINIPNVHINMEYMSEKDKEDIKFGIENDVDFIAASFVRSADDVTELRQFLFDNGGRNINIIAKIENKEGIKNIDAIIEKADGIMVARGDMGVELPEEDVPVVQKMIINKSCAAGKQVITATQMLDSMMKNPRPTRAEVTDVANAIYDGTSAIMLSGETAAGKYPVEAVKMMVRIALRTESAIDYKKRFFELDRKSNPDITDAISHATVTTAYDLNAAAIVTVTKSGRSAKMISRYRPKCKVIAGTTNEKVYRQLNLLWGAYPVLLKEKKDPFDLFEHAVDVAKEQKVVKQGDVAVITSGVPLGISGTTNLIKVHVVE